METTEEKRCTKKICWGIMRKREIEVGMYIIYVIAHKYETHRLVQIKKLEEKTNRDKIALKDKNKQWLNAI